MGMEHRHTSIVPNLGVSVIVSPMEHIHIHTQSTSIYDMYQRP